MGGSSSMNIPINIWLRVKKNQLVFVRSIDGRVRYGTRVWLMGISSAACVEQQGEGAVQAWVAALMNLTG